MIARFTARFTFSAKASLAAERHKHISAEQSNGNELYFADITDRRISE